MKKIARPIFFLFAIFILKGSFAFAADPKLNSSDLKSMTEEIGLSEGDIKDFLGAETQKTVPAKEKVSFDFSNLGSWALTILSLMGLVFFFYFIRKKL